MDEIKLSDDVFEQIKNFTHYRLTEEQESLIDKLITDKELKEQWIEYDKFEDAEYLAKGGFGITFKAVWKDGPILYWDCNNNQWKRKGQKKVALKYLHNSQDITVDFLKEVESNILVRGYVDCIVPCFDPLKRPNADELCKLILELLHDIRDNKVDSIIYRQVKETDDINKKLSFSSPLISTGTLSYETHPQAVYTSRLLDFKNLPKPKNADNDDLEYSDSLRMDFTKLDINSKDKRN
ncbi:uncharacterized protein OCT59_004555 [Rhizophagus irregularis]|uniref:uncharacterized protein n=1 Tax=Rhizophagus irregularis TaxID=588596 RepID=UPI003327EC92|nr:hypothetical protein OCT59_004555 [Rhizophagus irregularis]